MKGAATAPTAALAKNRLREIIISLPNFPYAYLPKNDDQRDSNFYAHHFGVKFTEGRRIAEGLTECCKNVDGIPF